MRLFLFFILLVMFSGCYNSARDCDRFKTGHFTSIVATDSKTYTSSFTRTDTLQIEKFEGNIDSSSVRWINDCEMIFHHLNPKNMSERKDDHVKILTTTDSSYTFEYSQVGKQKKIKGIAIKTN